MKNLEKTQNEAWVIALGNFDGIHIGHQALLRQGLEYASSLGLAFAVMLFAPHPQIVLQPHRSFRCLTDLDEMKRILIGFGVDQVLVYPFTKELAELSPQEFVRQILMPIGPVHVVVGYNYTFGKRAQGGAAELAEIGKQWGFSADIVPEQKIGDIRVSSTDIRQSLVQGQVEKAACMLGRPYRLRGWVEKGYQRGRELGFPTANLTASQDVVVPGRGVYAGQAFWQGESGEALISIGSNPTFADERKNSHDDVKIEVHILNFHGNLYGEALEVDFLAHIRPEKKFVNGDQLVEQIRADVVEAQALFKKKML